MDSREIAGILYAEIFCRYGNPSIFVSDRVQHFLSKLVSALCEIFDITRHKHLVIILKLTLLVKDKTVSLHSP